MWDFEHEPNCSRLQERYVIHKTMPSQCAVELAESRADIGLVPITAYATIPDVKILPGCTIASFGRIRSLQLITRADQPLKEIRSVATDTSSRATFTYTQILFRKYWNDKTTFLPHPPDLEAMLATADAALLIGDPALLAVEDQENRELRTGEKLTYYDLAHEWKQRSGVPWISAIWAVRPQAIQNAEIDPALIIEDFLNSRDGGLSHIEDLVAEWTTRIAAPPDTIRHYLTQNIHYILDEECIAGMELFYSYAAELGILPPVPDIRFL
jgi:chorismate dehydratase